jgi:hypothetical protein
VIRLCHLGTCLCEMARVLGQKRIKSVGRQLASTMSFACLIFVARGKTPSRFESVFIRMIGEQGSKIHLLVDQRGAPLGRRTDTRLACQTPQLARAPGQESRELVALVQFACARILMDLAIYG